MEQDVNRFWAYVKTHYPDARFVKWFDDGQLHFWPNGKAEREQKNLGCCYRDDRAHMVAKTGDKWR